MSDLGNLAKMYDEVLISGVEKIKSALADGEILKGTGAFLNVVRQRLKDMDVEKPKGLTAMEELAAKLGVNEADLPPLPPVSEEQEDV